MPKHATSLVTAHKYNMPPSLRPCAQNAEATAHTGRQFPQRNSILRGKKIAMYPANGDTLRSQSIMVGRLVMESYERLVTLMESSLMKAGNPTSGIFFKMTDQQSVQVMEESVEVQEGGATLHHPYFQMVASKTFRLNGNVFGRPLRGQRALYKFCPHNLFEIQFLTEPEAPDYNCEVEYLKDGVRADVSPVFESIIFRNCIWDPEMAALLFKTSRELHECGCTGLTLQSNAQSTATSTEGLIYEEEESASDADLELEDEEEARCNRFMPSQFYPNQVRWRRHLPPLPRALARPLAAL
jgi:hypothetical protein